MTDTPNTDALIADGWSDGPWAEKHRALERELAEERQEHRATLTYAAGLREALQAFVDANDKGPADGWLLRMLECDKKARAALK